LKRRFHGLPLGESEEAATSSSCWYFVCEMNQLLFKYLYIQVLGSSWGLYYYRLGCFECLYLVFHLQKSMGLLFFFFFFFIFIFRVLDVFQVANGNYSALFTKRRVSADDVQQQFS
jgi:hypothetical protein